MAPYAEVISLDGEKSVLSSWESWRQLAAPSLFLLVVIYYEELFLKVY